MAKRISGFEVSLIAYDPFPNAARAAELGAELLARSEVLSLHLPSLPSTRHFVNDDFLARVKPGAYLVNTARGALVDEGRSTARWSPGSWPVPAWTSSSRSPSIPTTHC